MIRLDFICVSSNIVIGNSFREWNSRLLKLVDICLLFLYNQLNQIGLVLYFPN